METVGSASTWAGVTCHVCLASATCGHLESPEPPDGELSVEIPYCGQPPRVTQVHEVKLAVEAAQVTYLL